MFAAAGQCILCKLESSCTLAGSRVSVLLNLKLKTLFSKGFRNAFAKILGNHAFDVNCQCEIKAFATVSVGNSTSLQFHDVFAVCG